MNKYAAILEEGPHNWSAYVPDLPGCVATWVTREETEQLIAEAIEFHIEGLLLDGVSLPEPTFDNLIELTHPGEMLREDFLEPMGLTAYQVAKSLGVQQTRISEILRGQRDISAETSLLLDTFFGLSDGYWLRLQTDYTLRKTRHALTEKISKVQPYANFQEKAA